MAMVTAASQMAGSVIRANSGITKTSDHVAPSTPTTGTPTKWVLVMANSDPLATRISLMATPSRTAASGAGNSDLASGVLGQISNKAKQTKPTNAAGQHRLHRRLDGRKSGVAIWLLKRHIAHRVGVVTDKVRHLFQDEQDADGGQQTTDNTVGEEVGKTPAQDAKSHLHHPSQSHRQQEGLKTTKTLDLREHNGGQTCGRTGHTDVGSADDAHDNAAHDAGDQSGHQGSTRSQSNPKAKRDGDQEDNNSADEISTDRLEWTCL